MTDETDVSRAWHYCLRHNTVERGVGCRAADRLGPYATEAEARGALEIARHRTETEDDADRRWDDD